MSEKEIILLTTYKDGNPAQENPFSERNAKLKIRAAKNYKNIKKIEKAEKVAEGEYTVLDIVWASADAASEVAAVSAMSTQLNAKDAEIEALKAQLAATTAPTPTPVPEPTGNAPEPAPEPTQSGKGKGK